MTPDPDAVRLLEVIVEAVDGGDEWELDTAHKLAAKAVAHFRADRSTTPRKATP